MALAPLLRQMHLPGAFRGVFTIRRGAGFFAHLIGWGSRFPPAGEGISTSLVVSADGARLRWLRQFGTVRVETLQWEEGGDLVEYFRPVSCHFRIDAEGGSLRYVMTHARLRLGPFAVTLPGWLSPKISGLVRATEESAAVEVSIAAPLIGEVLGYSGVVRPLR